jgi:hypothetical protein
MGCRGPAIPVSSSAPPSPRVTRRVDVSSGGSLPSDASGGPALAASSATAASEAAGSEQLAQLVHTIATLTEEKNLASARSVKYRLSRPGYREAESLPFHGWGNDRFQADKKATMESHRAELRRLRDEVGLCRPRTSLAMASL